MISIDKRKILQKECNYVDTSWDQTELHSKNLTKTMTVNKLTNKLLVKWNTFLHIKIYNELYWYFIKIIAVDTDFLSTGNIWLQRKSYAKNFYNLFKRK